MDSIFARDANQGNQRYIVSKACRLGWVLKWIMIAGLSVCMLHVQGLYHVDTRVRTCKKIG